MSLRERDATLRRRATKRPIVPRLISRVGDKAGLFCRGARTRCLPWKLLNEDIPVDSRPAAERDGPSLASYSDTDCPCRSSNKGSMCEGCASHSIFNEGCNVR